MRTGHILALSLIPAILSCQPVRHDSEVSVKDLHDEQTLRQQFVSDNSKVRLIALLSPN